jgi:hypothetical protein
LEVEPGTHCLADGGGSWCSAFITRKNEEQFAIKFDWSGHEEIVEVGKLRFAGNVPASIRPCLLLINAKAEEGQISLVRLSPELLTLAAVPKAERATISEKLSLGGTVSGTGTIIPLASISKLEGWEGGVGLTISSKENGKTISANVEFSTSRAREGLLAAVLEQASADWTPRIRKVWRWSAVLAMIAITAIVTVITSYLHFFATQAAAGKLILKSRFIKDAFLMVGPTGVSIVGGIALTVCAIGLFVALTAPPAKISYERKS